VTDEETAAEGAPAPAPRLTGRSALRAALWPPRAGRGQWGVALLLFVLGLALAIQVRATGSEETALRGARQEDLVRILSDLDDRTSRLEDERNDLEEQRTELETSSDQAEEARRQTAERERQLGVLAGTVAAEGPGITLRIDDPLGAVEADMLLDAVQELRAAGAEAIQINDIRIVASTSFVDDNGGARIDGRSVRAPFTVRAIGRPQDLEPALNIPGGVVQSLENEQVEVVVERAEKVTVDALRSAEQPDYAQSSS
jgi:uncharacterized protein YlxW (UPF0749 family)